MTTLALDPETDLLARRRQGSGLRRLRERLGLTQAQMSRRLNMSAENLRNYEQGDQVIRILDVYAWAPAYEIAAEEFVRALGVFAPVRSGEWWARAELEAEGMPADEIERIEATLIDRPLDHQPAVLDVLVRAWRRSQRRRSSRRRADDGIRDYG